MRPFDDHVVTSVVPAGFAAYARVFHPALRAGRPIRWATVAEGAGRTAHPGMQWWAVAGKAGRGWDAPPRVGSLPAAPAERLARVLRRHTATPEDCWFAVWEGFVGLAVPADAPRLRLPERTMLVLRGPVSAASASLAPAPDDQRAGLWWPEDRAWCVATEVDFDSTLVGGSRACVADVLADDALEAAPVPPDQSMSFDGDDRNPLPELP